MTAAPIRLPCSNTAKKSLSIKRRKSSEAQCSNKCGMYVVSMQGHWQPQHDDLWAMMDNPHIQTYRSLKCSSTYLHLQFSGILSTMLCTARRSVWCVCTIQAVWFKSLDDLRRPYKHQIVNPSSPSTSTSTVYNYDIRPECQFETRSLYTCTENLQSENWLLVCITPPQSFRGTTRLPASSGRTLQHLSKQLQ